jgi:hypothetical protein
VLLFDFNLPLFQVNLENLEKGVVGMAHKTDDLHKATVAVL